jgi:hypothetical protein
MTYILENSKLLLSSIVKIKITSKLCFGLVYLLNYAIWLNLLHNIIYHFYFSMHKLNFNLKFCTWWWTS